MEKADSELTVGQLSKLMAERLGRYSEDYQARQLRGFLQHGCITPHRRIGEGMVKTAVFTPPDIAKASLIVALASAGLSRENLVAANGCFDNIHHEDRAKPNTLAPTGFAQIFDRIRIGEEWFFNFYLAPGQEPGGLFSRKPLPTPPAMPGYVTTIVSTAHHVASLFTEPMED